MNVSRLLLLAMILFASVLDGQVPPTRWALQPELRIGSLNAPDHVLSAVGDITVDRDGGIYVTQPAERTVKVFDAQGRFLRTIGRDGAGPGEFRSLGRIGLVGDTLWAYDAQLSRQTLFSRTGEVLEALIVTGPMIPEVATRPTPPHFLSSDGTILARPYSRDDLEWVPLVRMDRAGGLIELLGAVRNEPPARMVGSVNGRPMSAMVTRPVSTSGLWDVSSIDGSVIIVDRPVPTGEGEAAFRVQRFRSAGVPAFDRLYRYTPRPIPRSTVDSILSRDDLLGDLPTPPEMLEQFRAQLGPMPYDTPVTWLLAGRDGTIWLRRDQLGRGEVDWMILDSEGEPIGSLTTPVGLRILEADRNEVWGVETDEFDVPYVVRHRIERR